MANNWYQDLIGKEIILKRYDRECLCIVSYFDYDFGFTIQEKRDMHYVFCYRGPSAKVPRCGSAKRDHIHRKYMTAMAKKFREGIIDVKEPIVILSEFRNTQNKFIRSLASAQTCPFSQ